MPIEYRYVGDADYINATCRRQYAQAPLVLRLPIQFGILGILGGIFWIWKVKAVLLNKVVDALLIASLTTMVGVRGTKAGLLARFKRRADFGSEVKVVLSDDGLLVTRRQSQTNFPGTHIPDQLVSTTGSCFRETRRNRWLPDSGLSSESRRMQPLWSNRRQAAACRLTTASAPA